MFTLGGWWEKVIVQNDGRALMKPKNQPGRVVLAPQWLKWSKIYTVDVCTAKTSSNTGYSTPDTCQCLKLSFEPFTSSWIHPCYNQPWVGRPKFRLETNSTVVWLYAGGVSLILPDVCFGMVSQDWVTYIDNRWMSCKGCVYVLSVRVLSCSTVTSPWAVQHTNNQMQCIMCCVNRHWKMYS